MIQAAVRALLAGIVDYAGLFPPAGLDMRSAVANYARYLASEDAWALGRFVVPAARLDELAAAREGLPLPGAAAAAAEWRVSAILGGAAAGDVERVRRFNREQMGRWIIDVVEAKLATVEEIAAAPVAPRGIELFVEVPVAEDPTALIGAIRDRGVKAKIRMGGVTPEAFPAPPAVARFMRQCHDLGVPFKATAGLHHPLRGSYALTYAPDAARAPMYGFLNVLLAAALVERDASEDEVLFALQADDPSSVRADSEALSIAGVELGAAESRRLRECTVQAFGSCSFREPMDELRRLGIA